MTDDFELSSSQDSENEFESRRFALWLSRRLRSGNHRERDRGGRVVDFEMFARVDTRPFHGCELAADGGACNNLEAAA